AWPDRAGLFPRTAPRGRVGSWARAAGAAGAVDGAAKASVLSLSSGRRGGAGARGAGPSRAEWYGVLLPAVAAAGSLPGALPRTAARPRSRLHIEYYDPPAGSGSQARRCLLLFEFGIGSALGRGDSIGPECSTQAREGCEIFLAAGK
ncbi:Keratin, type II cytoskeletal 7, partial [Frankliniella fusca]